MPTRYITLLIVVFWLAMTGWLFYRDVRPHVLPGAPPPFTISLVDEAEAQKNEGTYWSIVHGEQTMGYAITRVRYLDQTDSFELMCVYKLWVLGRFSSPTPNLVSDSTYRVSRDGELERIRVDLKADLEPLASLRAGGHLEGQAVNGQLMLHARSDLGDINQSIGPVDIRGRSSLLNPLQPLNRLSGLRRGQHWQMPMVGPLSDVLGAVVQKFPALSAFSAPRVNYLDAQVLPDTVMLDRNDGKTQVECLLVEYRGEDVTAHTWVGLSDDLVYQQEMARQGEQPVRLVRQDPGSRIRDEFEHPRPR